MLPRSDAAPSLTCPRLELPGARDDRLYFAQVREDPALEIEALGMGPGETAMATDEVRHAQGAFDLVAARVRRDPALVPVVLQAASGFHHFGEEAVAEVPVAEAGDAQAIRSFARRIERLCGVRLVDHLRATLPG